MSLDVWLEKEVKEIKAVFDGNITHNMTEMADHAGLYRPCWRPEEMGIAFACELSPFLRVGINHMKSKTAFFKAFNPINGWGDYEVLLKFAERYLAACEEHPDAVIKVNR